MPAATSHRPCLAIGTSGWSHPAWRQGFYAGVPQRRWLAHCAAHFTGIEVNATFYRQLKPETIARWHDETPDGFTFAVKGHRFVTHVRRLKDVGDALSRSRDGLAPLGDKLAVVLWQLPPSLAKDTSLLRVFGEQLAVWPDARHAIEFRHKSWFDAETRTVLADHNLATVISDAPRWPMWDAVRANLAYVRLHGHERLYASAYGKAGLEPWTRKVMAWCADSNDIHVYFDNDAEGAAPYDAMTLLAMVRGDQANSTTTH